MRTRRQENRHKRAETRQEAWAKHQPTSIPGQAGATITITRRLRTEPWQEDFLDRKMRQLNKMYNVAVKYHKPILDALQADEEFDTVKKRYLKLAKVRPPKQPFEDKKLEREYQGLKRLVNATLKACGFTKSQLEAYMIRLKNRAYQGMGSDITQRLAERLLQAIEKVIWGTGRSIHYRKAWGTNSFCEKRNDTGIILKMDDTHAHDVIRVMGQSIPIKPVRPSDDFMRIVLETGTVRYSRITREPFGERYHYFVQTVMAVPFYPCTKPMGTGDGFVDPGMSIMAVDSDDYSEIFILADGKESYEAAIADAQRDYDRKCRANNPDNYNPDGTVRRDTRSFRKEWHHSSNMRRSVMRLKSAYRKKASFVRNSHGRQKNLFLAHVSRVGYEDMSYRGLAKKAKRDATNPNKRRKRFGGSVSRNAPASWLSGLASSLVLRGQEVVVVDTFKTRLSQLDHVSGGFVRCPLSVRVKVVGGNRVQRDLYSAFLGRHTLSGVTDLVGCVSDFGSFLVRQAAVMGRLSARSGVPSCVGVKDFLAEVA